MEPLDRGTIYRVSSYFDDDRTLAVMVASRNCKLSATTLY